MHALLIGNSNYHAGPLKNPGNDAKLMDQTLTGLGFKTTLLMDLDLQQMDQAVSRFAARIPKNGLGFFFFAGHGIQINKENFLIPVDAELRDEASVKYKTLSLSYIIDAMKASPGNMNIVVLDACRDNPFERSLSRSVANRGLATLPQIPEGSVVAYSTGDNLTAKDGNGANSPYTWALAQCLASWQTEYSDRPLRDVFFRASKAVKDTAGQRPHLYIDASMEAFYMNGSVPTKPINLVPQMANNIPAVPNQPLAPPPSASPASSHMDALADTVTTTAAQLAKEKKFDQAIDMLSSFIETPNLSPSLKHRVYGARSGLYLSRNGTNDMQLAINDAQASGQKGVQLVVRRDTSLKVGSESRGRLKKYDNVLVSRINKDWYWIAQVNGLASPNGWVTSQAFEEVKAPKPEPAKPAVTQFAQPQQQQFNQNRGFQQPSHNQRNNHQNRNNVPSGADAWTRNYIEKNGRPPSIWQTPRWESPAEIRQLRAKGLIR